MAPEITLEVLATKFEDFVKSTDKYREALQKSLDLYREEQRIVLTKMDNNMAGLFEKIGLLPCKQRQERTDWIIRAQALLWTVTGGAIWFGITWIINHTKAHA